jgi:hypothetical protein
MGTVDALAVSAAFPAAGGALVMVRGRKLDPIAVLSLAAIAVGLSVPDQPDARAEYDRTWQSAAVRAEARRATAG